jgi:hypothetical protein
MSTAVAALGKDRRPLLLLLTLALVATMIAVVLAVSSGGDSAAPTTGPLGWATPPDAFTHPTMPTDHIVFGKIRNTGSSPLRIVARTQIRVETANGTQLITSAVFSQSYGHQMFDPTRTPQGRLPEPELRRIGDVAYLKPGAIAPLTVSWHEDPGEGHGARVFYPGGSLDIPAEK